MCCLDNNIVSGGGHHISGDHDFVSLSGDTINIISSLLRTKNNIFRGCFSSEKGMLASFEQIFATGLQNLSSGSGRKTSFVQILPTFLPSGSSASSSESHSFIASCFLNSDTSDDTVTTYHHTDNDTPTTTSFLISPTDSVVGSNSNTASTTAKMLKKNNFLLREKKTSFAASVIKYTDPPRLTWNGFKGAGELCQCSVQDMTKESKREHVKKVNLLLGERPPLEASKILIQGSE